MRYYFLVLMAVSAVSANVDIIKTDQGLCIGWIVPSGPVVKNLDESSQIQFNPIYQNGHISIGDGPDTGVSSLVVALSDQWEEVPDDSLILLDAQSMTRLSSREVISDSILEEPYYPVPIRVMSVSRYDYGMRDLLACIISDHTSSMSYTWITNSAMVLDGNDIDLIEHKQCYHAGPVNDYSQSPRPFNLMGSSVIAFREYNWFSHEYYHSVVSLSYDMPIETTDLLPPLFEYSIYSETNYSSSWARVIAAGSDLGITVALWGESGLDNVYTSIFIDDVQPTSTEAFPFPYPRNQPSAMSCHPYYDGMLLAWIQGSELRCRHFDGEWNDYDHIVQSGLGTVTDQNIAVCSDVDGYWIAWLENGASEPEVVFVPRDSVTGISGSGISSIEMTLDLFPNPFGNVLHIAPSGFTGNCRISIYDTAGRIVESTTMSSDVWDWDASSIPTGLYSIVAESPEGTISRRVMHLGLD
ncbi:MAG: T9SS type A sorting domain-containing protein [Candidatus Aegiribacteria sp.]|nr:T9SS type A sorting domain-containing protein [Candidatus Aegiribacteria sp.]